MDEPTFQSLARRAKLLTSNYGAGYARGLRRHFHGERFGTPEEHELHMRLGLDGDHREELGRGYRDGFAGQEPAPPIGRPPAAPEQALTATIHARVTRAQADKLERLGGASWLRERIDRAREP